MMAGREDVARETAVALAGKSTPELLRMPGVAGSTQHYLLGPVFVSLRFQRWPDVLAAAAPPSDLPYATGLWRYARGVALAHSGNPGGAEAELAELRQTAAAPELKELYILGYNSGASVLELATHALMGEIAAAKQQWDAAAQHLRQAVTISDGFIYIEPPEWSIPVRQDLGRVLMSAGRAADAERVYRDDLERFPETVWSLEGLAKSLEAQGKSAEAAEVRARLEKARGTHAGAHH
jgi:predicted Zn-dependent protease